MIVLSRFTKRTRRSLVPVLAMHVGVQGKLVDALQLQP